MSEIYHTIILGLGAMGSASAYHLARRGRRVLGLERFAPGHSLGSSHGQTRIIRLAYFEDPAYVPLLLRAYELWEELGAAAPEPLLRLTGGLMIGDANSQVVAGSIGSARAHGLAHQVLDAAEIRRRFPIFSPEAGEIALYEERAGMLYPEAAIAAHLRGAAAAGAELRFAEPALDWQAAPSGDRVRVTTAGGSYEAERLIIAAGAYAPALLADLGLPLSVQRNVLYWLAPTRQRELFAPERCPIYIWEPADDLTLYGFPEVAGAPAGVKVAFHHHGPICTPETIDRQVAAAELARVRAWLDGRMPALAGAELTGASTCMYTLTPDQDFLIDAHPRHPHVLIASPCSGHGYKFASVVGEIMADLAESGRSARPIAKFGAGRFGA